MNSTDELRDAICEIGRRMYARGFCAANEGNISVRAGDRIICTPTRHCKGFMNPRDLCEVNLAGDQLGGDKKRTSEILLHLEVYKARQDVNAVVHCHPPHATAFAATGQPIPMGVLPEAEVFLGQVPTAPYVLPGTHEFAKTILPYVRSTNSILLANHGTVTFADQLELAYWLTEILDSYCRVMIHAQSLGPLVHFSPQQRDELKALRHQWGFSDHYD